MLTYAKAGERFGYTRWSMVNLVRDTGRGLTCSPRAQARSAARPAPAKDRVRGRVIELRREGLSTYEISRGWPPKAGR